MATYTLELTKKIMRDYTITIPDSVSREDAREWCDEIAPDLWEVEEHHSLATWEDVNDLKEGEKVTVSVKCDFEDDEYVVDGFLRSIYA